MSEADEWSVDGHNILSPEKLEAIQRVLAQGPLIVEHWHYRGSRAPSRLIFDDYEDLQEYLKNSAVPGDAFHMYDYAACCPDDKALVDGKYPDPQGRVPKHGAY